MNNMENWEIIAGEMFKKEFKYFKGNKGRRPDSVTFSDIETDVKRRDLTVNALFYDIKTKEIVDLVGGIEDIKNGVIRTVGVATERFGEDRLRILRAIRFAARTGSNLDKDIDKELRKNSSLNGISSERIMDEFIKGIKSAKSTKYFLHLINIYNLFPWVLKNVSPLNKEFIDSNNPILVLSILLKNVSYHKISEKLGDIKYPSSITKKIAFLIAFNKTFSKETFYTLKKMHKVSGLEDETFKEFAKISNIDLDLVDKFINHKFTIKGNYVMSKYNIKNKEVGDKIEELETQLFFNK